MADQDSQVELLIIRGFQYLPEEWADEVWYGMVWFSLVFCLYYNTFALSSPT